MPAHSRRFTAFLVAMALLIVTPLAVIAADKFDDVPDSNIFHDDIAWLADADVTRGCNPPDNTQFCPDDNVTRGQMAAFMNRLANNRVVHAATARDSERLDGRDATEYQTVLAFFQCGFITPAATDCPTAEIPQAEGVAVAEATLEAPADGVVEIHGSTAVRTTGSPMFIIWVSSEAQCANAGQGAAAQAIGRQVAGTSAQGEVETVTVQAADSVTAGPVTYYLCGFHFGAPAAQPVWTAQLSLRWNQSATSAITPAASGRIDHAAGGLGG